MQEDKSCLSCSQFQRDGSRIIHVQHAPATSEPFIPRAIEHLANANLSQSGRAHHAWFYSDVERHVLKRKRVRFQNLIERHQFGVERCLKRAELFLGSFRERSTPTKLTFLHSLVRFLAFAIATPFWTNTQPTGTSLAARASSA